MLDERRRRRWAAAESMAIGYGGDAFVSSATGLAREAIRKGARGAARLRVAQRRGKQVAEGNVLTVGTVSVVIAAAGAAITVAALIWGMFACYDSKNRAAQEKAEKDNKEAHAGIVTRIERVENKVVEVSENVMFLRGYLTGRQGDGKNADLQE